MKPPVFSVAVPEYQVETEPNHRAVGKIVDAVIKEHFLGQTLVVRGIGSLEHPGKSVDGLIATIQALGTDRYDPARKGDRYENVAGKHIDFFAFRRKIMPTTELFKDISWGFYHGAKKIHGRPVRIDILLLYDASQLKAILHRYADRIDAKRDGFVFKDPTNKQTALLGIIKIQG